MNKQFLIGDLMDMNRVYITEIRAIDPRTRELARYYGPEVHALTPGLAQKWCDNNGYGYCKVVGEKIGEYIEGNIIHTEIQKDATVQMRSFRDN